MIEVEALAGDVVEDLAALAHQAVQFLRREQFGDQAFVHLPATLAVHEYFADAPGHHGAGRQKKNPSRKPNRSCAGSTCCSAQTARK